MIKADGIMAFHGSMLYDPPNPRGRKELKGDFIHRDFDGEGYWYDGWSSYDDRFCKDIREEMVSTDIFEELEHRLSVLKGLAATGENLPEILAIIENTSEWVNGVRAGAV